MAYLIKDLFNLNKGEEDKAKTLEDVKSNISFTGSNLWILMCAIIVASVGLNVNSTAVIIGAMLISPLMGPIVGAGFALGIYDFKLLKRSLTNLLIATIASLTVATIYFYLSPFKEVQSELLARTAPNIYDVLIAFFGGLVGVIAITRVEKGNPIPGVAIATALMPPLCTAGYGIATGNLKFFLGALFLYSINCVFICISTFIIVKYLNYPAVQNSNLKYQKQVKYGITILVFLMLVPSGFFAYSLFKKQQFLQKANTFIENEFISNGSILVYKKLNYNSNPKSIELAFLKKNYSPTEIKTLNNKLIETGFRNTKLIIKQDSTDNLEAFKSDILNEVNKKSNALSEKDQTIALLEQKLAKNNFDNKQLLSEINVVFPSVKAIAISNQNIATADSSQNLTIAFYESTKEMNKVDKQKLLDLLKRRLQNDKLILAKSDN